MGIRIRKNWGRLQLWQVEQSGILIYRDIAALRERHMVHDDAVGTVAEG